MRAYAQASTLPDGYNCITDCQVTIGDGLGGLYVWSSASAATDDNLTVIAPTGYPSGRWLKVGVGGIGPVGPAGSVSVGTVSQLSSGATPTVTNTGTAQNAILNFGIPAGPTGSGSTFAWGGATGTLSAQTDLQNALNLKAPLASPALTGSPTVPTATAGTNTTQAASTAFVAASFATLASPALTGVPTAPVATYGTATNQVSTTAFADALRDIPQNSQTAAYTLALADRAKHISITTGGITIPANASVAFPVGAVVNIFNNSASTQTISITSDTLRQSGTNNVGTRTLAVYGLVTLVKVAATVWLASGDIS